jgi:hypothetical protein
VPVVQAVVVLSREAEIVAPLTLLPKASGPPSCGLGRRNLPSEADCSASLNPAVSAR